MANSGLYWEALPTLRGVLLQCGVLPLPEKRMKCHFWYCHHFLKIISCIYLWLCGVLAAAQAFLGLLPSHGAQAPDAAASPAAERALQGTQAAGLLQHVGSEVTAAVPGLWSTSSTAVAHGLSCSETCGVFPDQGSDPCLLHWQAETLPLSHQGSPAIILLVPSLSQCLLALRKCRAALSVGTGPRRVSPLLSRLQSTPWTLYWPPDHGSPQPNPIPPLLPCDSFHLCKHSPPSSPSVKTQYHSFQWVRLAEAKDETGSSLVTSPFYL